MYDIGLLENKFLQKSFLKTSRKEKTLKLKLKSCEIIFRKEKTFFGKF